MGRRFHRGCGPTPGRCTAAVLAIALGAIIQAPAAEPSPRIGVVVMHGKGGGPTKYVAGLASSLEEKGYLVANLEMPWSGNRSYDANVADAESQVESALGALRARGAAKLFIAGHSQGGLFALYFGGQHPVDGVIAIAPGGNVGSPNYRDRLGGSVTQARQLVANGKGNEKTRFIDFEGSRGTYPVVCTPANYLSWFDPEGAMNEVKAVKAMNPRVPVLFIVPTGDYPPLLKAKELMFGALPRHPLTRLYEPDAGHLDAPAASVDEIVRWISEVAAQPAAVVLVAPQKNRAGLERRASQTARSEAPAS
jgi:pimeloyl-ACP methyl ester carboxylesterase